MAAVISEAKWLRAAVTLALAALSVSTAASVYFFKRKLLTLNSKLRERETSLKSSLDKCASERQGRIRAQQALRKALTNAKPDNLQLTAYPMTPIGVIQSCFSTRNGTPRQPLLVPLSRACLVFNLTRVPSASLEGLGEYSHCWVLYVFHFNTDLDKLWKHPSESKFKAKVRVPRLKGGRVGVFATRSPHRPCPIGLTVAKVEAVKENAILLSGVDLVDGTPVLDIKPYIPYCDSIQAAKVPEWLMLDSTLAVASISFSQGFMLTLADCWKEAGKKSLYASPDEFRSLIEQVLSWDIRSLSQRNRPHDGLSRTEARGVLDAVSDIDEYQDGEVSLLSKEVIYHLILEGLDISYRIDCNGNVIVDKAAQSTVENNNHNCYSSEG